MKNTATRKIIKIRCVLVDSVDIKNERKLPCVTYSISDFILVNSDSELNDRDVYDGIWACASILHLTKEELPGVICRMRTALKENGVIYTFFKYGTFEGERNGRYFTYFTEESFSELLAQITGLQTEKMWITGDVREGRGDERWLNVILRRICSL